MDEWVYVYEIDGKLTVIGEPVVEWLRGWNGFDADSYVFRSRFRPPTENAPPPPADGHSVSCS